MRYRVLLLIFLFGFAPTDARKANEAYRNGEYERAAELYQQAIQADPENARLHFNLGNTLARLGHREEAVRSFEMFRSLSEDPAEHALADYSIGNLYSESEEFDTAAQHYRNALTRNPEDPDAIHNYELAMRQLHQQQDQQSQGDEQEQEQEGEQQEQEQDGDGDGDDSQNQDQQQEQPQPQPDQESEQESPQPQSQMSLEEAESILDALEQRERELLRDRQKEPDEPISNENDW